VASLTNKLGWYWYRFKAMGPSEVRTRFEKKLYQIADSRGLPDWSKLSLETGRQPTFPELPLAASAPEVLREALRKDSAEIKAGRWKAFGHLDLKVDDPPRWHMDYLVGKDFETDRSSFKLDHRKQPAGADIKVIWEPNRWYQLVRLAQSAYVLEDQEAGRTCVRWLTDWVTHNRPYRGLNWTSALETGMRLVQITWIDALLDAAGYDEGELCSLRSVILPPHVYYTWRYRSFGSSANNHLLGELAGLVLAIARWPSLAGLSTSLDELRGIWEREVLEQFAPDGGNREQALGYHLFSWEFCWQIQAALRAAGKHVSSSIEERLNRATEFYSLLKIDKWDYGDSDNAFVTPFFADETKAAEEWRDWFLDSAKSPAIQYWLGNLRSPVSTIQESKSKNAHAASVALPSSGSTNPHSASLFPRSENWRILPDSGYAVYASQDWTLRWDLSSLGYLSTAAHGHLDALHLSIWHRGVGFIIDPGTGAYYADAAVRTRLASWGAHNGPNPGGASFPKRIGTFLWGKPHATPLVKQDPAGGVIGEFTLPAGVLRRSVKQSKAKDGWQVEDSFWPNDPKGNHDVTVRWQFAPGTVMEKRAERTFMTQRAGATLWVQVDETWSKVETFIPTVDQSLAIGHTIQQLGNVPIEAVCSPSFRRIEVGPYLLLEGQATKSGTFKTEFLAA
jgi:Heparinase II/III-like protein/Heparinase II/III N-terminus